MALRQEGWWTTKAPREKPAPPAPPVAIAALLYCTPASVAKLFLSFAATAHHTQVPWWKFCPVGTFALPKTSADGAQVLAALTNGTDAAAGDDGDCVACPAGQFSKGMTDRMTPCQDCPKGQITDADSAGCKAGTYPPTPRPMSHNGKTNQRPIVACHKHRLRCRDMADSCRQEERSCNSAAADCALAGDGRLTAHSGT